MSGEMIIDDTGDAPVADDPVEPADSAAAAPPEEPVDADAPPAADDPEPQEDDDEPMTMAQARKLRRENQQLRQERKSDRDRLAEIDKAAMSEHEKAIEAAKEETAAEYKAKMAERDLLLAAKGRLRDPEDAKVFIAMDDPDEDFEAAIDALLEARPYLGVGDIPPATVDQGARKSPEPKGKSLGELMAEQKQKRGPIRL